jgi:hypothetical protein
MLSSALIITLIGCMPQPQPKKIVHAHNLLRIIQDGRVISEYRFKFTPKNPVISSGILGVVYDNSKIIIDSVDKDGNYIGEVTVSIPPDASTEQYRIPRQEIF